MEDTLSLEVRRRARDKCEYCLIAQEFYPAPFQVDHIVARQHGGETILRNLALSCLHCNSHKGPNIGGLDPLRRRLTALYNPRRHKWERHFRFSGAELIGRTAIGRTTIVVLNMNGEFLRFLRQELLDEGVFGP